MILLTVGFAVVSIRAKLPVVWLTMWQPEQPILLNAWNPAVIEAADAAELDAAAVDVGVEGVEDPAAIGKTEAIVRAVDAGVVEVVVDAGVAELLVDATDDVVNGTAGVGGASKRMNDVKLTTSELKSDGALALLIVSTVLTVSSGSGLGAHCGLAVVVAGGVKLRLSGNRSLVTPSSTL